MEAWLHERLLRLAKAAGVLGHRRVVDSTGIADCVLTQDTVSLVRAALRRCLARLAELDPEKLVPVLGYWPARTTTRPASRRSAGRQRENGRHW